MTVTSHHWYLLAKVRQHWTCLLRCGVQWIGLVARFHRSNGMRKRVCHCRTWHCELRRHGKTICAVPPPERHLKYFNTIKSFLIQLTHSQLTGLTQHGRSNLTPTLKPTHPRNSLLSQSRVGHRGDEPSVRRAEASARPNPPYTLLWTETHVFTFEF